MKLQKIKIISNDGMVSSPIIIKKIKFSVLEELLFLFDKSIKYKVVYGGRGSTKSRSIAQVLIFFSMKYAPCKILCCRQFQASIHDSVHGLLSDIIMNLGLDKYFLITNNSIKNIWGSEFYFTGLQINPQSLKSKEGYLFCWIEEAENIEERAFNILNPTIRLSGCNIFISFNPVDINGFIYKNFVTNNNRTNCRIQQINYTDNIWASKEFIDDAEYMLKNDIQQYNHHYLGAPLRISDAVIFKDRWEVSTIEYEVRSLHEELYLYTNHELVNGGNNQLLYGLDYGFTDALAIIECFAHNAILYVTNELYRSQLPILDIAKEAITLMPYIDRYKVACDDSAPSIINALCAEGNYRLNATRAYKGEIMHGIIIMKQFRKIIIDKKCKNLIREIANYKYSQDKITGEIDKKPIDKNNHAIDALRYAVTYMMNNREEQ